MCDRVSVSLATGIYAQPDPDNNRYIHACIVGPENTPFAGGFFEIEVFLDDKYPIAPPQCMFTTPCFHPNLDLHGRICLDTLKAQYTPALTISAILLSIQNLLMNPNVEDPLDVNIAREWRENPAAAQAKARKMTMDRARLPPAWLGESR